jgi:hypothetical protein
VVFLHLSPDVVIAVSPNSSHHGICGSSHKTKPLTATAKTNKNRNEQILRNAEDAVRRAQTEESHKCHRKERLTKMTMAYKIGTHHRGGRECISNMQRENSKLYIDNLK